MKQLTLYDLLVIAKEMTEGKTEAQQKKIKVYIGNDEELNGVHGAYYCQDIRKDDGYNDFLEDEEMKVGDVLIS